jgi:hypothetical protein
LPSLRFDLPPPCQARGSVLVKWLARSVACFGGPSRCVCAALAQLVRAPGCGPGGPWFETRRRYHTPINGLTAPFASSETAKFVLGDTYGRAQRAPHPCRRTSSRYRQTTFRNHCHSRPRIIARKLPQRLPLVDVLRPVRPGSLIHSNSDSFEHPLARPVTLPSSAHSTIFRPKRRTPLRSFGAGRLLIINAESELRGGSGNLYRDCTVAGHDR